MILLPCDEGEIARRHDDGMARSREAVLEGQRPDQHVPETRAASRERVAAVDVGRYPCSLCVMTGGPASLTYEDITINDGAANPFIPTDEPILVAPSVFQ